MTTNILLDPSDTTTEGPFDMLDELFHEEPTAYRVAVATSEPAFPVRFSYVLAFSEVSPEQVSTPFYLDEVPDVDVAGSYGSVAPQNTRLLAFVEMLTSTPDDRGESWWREFDELLERNRFGIRPDPETWHELS